MGGTRPIMEQFCHISIINNDSYEKIEASKVVKLWILYSLLILVTAHWKQFIILKEAPLHTFRSTISYLWTHLLILVLHTEVMEPCASTSMTRCFQKYEDVLLLSMIDCFQCAVISMSKEYNSEKYFKFMGLLENNFFIKMYKKYSAWGQLSSIKL